MSSTPAQDLAAAFYSLEELEFFRPGEKFPNERAAVRKLVERAQMLAHHEFHSFSTELIQVISSYCHDKKFDQNVLFRAFDGVDQVLEINYEESPQMMPESDASERLYEGGGVGVQTSYSTITKVLEHLQLPPNAHLVDLGSGFGRVGLTTGLWRPELRFSGYEYVGHRVDASNASATRAGVSERVRFYQQNLSDRNFTIPSADAFYLYDPFSADTYEHVCTRLSELGRERPTAIIAKAGARKSFQRWMKESEWQEPESLDEGTILLYRSR